VTGQNCSEQNGMEKMVLE